MGAPEFVKYYQDGLSRKSTISGKLDYIRDALHDVGVDGAWSRTPDYSKENYLKNIERELYGEYKIIHLNREVKDLIKYLDEYSEIKLMKEGKSKLIEDAENIKEIIG